MEPKIQIVPPDQLWIEWEDGHQSSFRFDRLRSLCPCAGCEGERSRAGDPLRILREAGPEAARLMAHQRVGRYALSIVWGDGHNTGIYPWTYLRRSCGCFGCRRIGQSDPTPSEGGTAEEAR